MPAPEAALRRDLEFQVPQRRDGGFQQGWSPDGNPPLRQDALGQAVVDKIRVGPVCRRTLRRRRTLQKGEGTVVDLIELVIFNIIDGGLFKPFQDAPVGQKISHRLYYIARPGEELNEERGKTRAIDKCPKTSYGELVSA
ncbi:MAG: hypothetical protein MZV70_00910 [Desulfobacterales bacterium]|nr:hypothetical protein [Desulfobacterales bacterium]